MNFSLAGPAALVLSLVVVLACGCSDETSQDHVDRAKLYIDELQLPSATIELKNALLKNGDSAEARWLLGQTYLKTGDVESATKELQRAKRLGWSGNDVVPALAKALLAQGSYVQVRELSGRGLTSASLAELMSVQALSEFAQGNTAQANKLISRATKTQPDSNAILLAEARILAGQNDYTGALSSVAAVLDKTPDSGPAWSLHGDIKMRQAKPEDALEAYIKSLQYQPYNLLDRLKRALVRLQLRDFNGAMSDAIILLKESPQNPGGNYIRGLVVFQNKQYAEAILPLSLAEPAWQKFPLVLFFLGSSHLITGNIDQGAIFASRFFDLYPNHVPGRKLLATIRLKQEKYTIVQDLLAPVLETTPNDVDALTLMANALLYDAKFDEGIALLSRAAELRPDSASAQLRLGTSLLLGGNQQEATQHIETALDLDPRYQQAGILLVLNHLQNRDFDAAIEAANTYRRRRPGDTSSHNLLGRVYLASEQPEKARTAFEKALTLRADDPSANHNLAQMALEKNDLPAARERYEAVLSSNPGHLGALLQLALLDAREGSEEAMVKHLEKAMEANPSALEPRLLLGRYYLSRGKPDLLPPLFSTLEVLQRRSPRVMQLLALAQISGAQHQEAQYTLEQILRSTPESPGTHHLLAMAAAGSGDLEKSRAELRAALALDSSYLPSRVALARMDLAAQSLEDFSHHLSILIEQAPESPDVLQLQAAGAGAEGNHQQSVAFARRAYDAAPETFTMLELAHYLKTSGAKTEAYELLQEWVVDHPQDIPARLSLASELRAAGRPGESMAQYEAILEVSPDNLVALTNLSWYLRETDTEQAVELAYLAEKLAPDTPEVLNTVAIAAYHNEDYITAVRSIRRAVAKAPNNPGYRYHKAMIEAARGNREEARKILERLTGTEQAFPERAQASALLNKLQ